MIPSPDSNNKCEICGKESIGLAVSDMIPISVEVCTDCLQRPVVPLWLAKYWFDNDILNDKIMLKMEVYHNNKYIKIIDYFQRIC